MKIITFYLPQFHTIKENDEWWGQGFTEWVNVKRGTPLFEGHYQPRVPENQNYYNLLDDDVKRWQCELAMEHGVYGFCMYHYWFGGKLLLEKPVEQYLANKSLPQRFMLCWANEHWTNAWVSSNAKVLIEQEYGNEAEWAEHFAYLLPFLQDPRYICQDGRPLLMIYRPDLIHCLNDMLDCWQRLAKEAGLPGLCFLCQGLYLDYLPKKDLSRFDYDIQMQPNYALTKMRRQKWKRLRMLKAKTTELLDKVFHTNLSAYRVGGLTTYPYEQLWEYILATGPGSDKSLPGAFVDWDNTSRRGEQGWAITGATPEKFARFLKEQIRRTRTVYKKDYLFMHAWNEWAEAGYLEPDERYGSGYLQAIKEALEETGEFPAAEQ